MNNHYRQIEVVPYDPNWPKIYTTEACSLWQALGDNCLAIHHVGSTSVPGLAAKPKIDVIAVVKDAESTIEALKPLEYAYKGEYNIPFHYGFSKRGAISFNLHLYEEGHPEIALNLTFRDYLRNHPEMRNAYAALKYELLQNKSAYEKTNSLFTGYNLGKNTFITQILKLAEFKEVRFVRCTHYDEWNAAKRLRQRQFFDKVPIQDPYEWTFNHPDHLHFILYSGVEIVGYAHVQLCAESIAILRIIAIEENHRGGGLGKTLLQRIERWLEKSGRKCLYTDASPDALSFYLSQGYTEMVFDDPEVDARDSRDTPVGKHLSKSSKNPIHK